MRPNRRAVSCPWALVPSRKPRPNAVLAPQLQRRHRDERLLGNRDVLDYLLSVGVERVQCLMVYGKASEALLLKYGPEEVRKDAARASKAWIAHPRQHNLGASAAPKRWLTLQHGAQELELEDVQASVEFLKSQGLEDTMLPKVRGLGAAWAVDDDWGGRLWAAVGTIHCADGSDDLSVHR